MPTMAVRVKYIWSCPKRSLDSALGSLTQHLSDGSTEGEVGVHLDVTLKPILRRELRQANWERDRYLWVRFGYRLLGTRGHTDDPSTEHRGSSGGHCTYPTAS